ncbi:MAG: amino acid permease [Alphaproteobacteria bacterium]|nr:amino acid permease [Alphaproteobacteria bacterium]
MQWLRIRSVESLGGGEHSSLKRTLGAVDLTLLGIGCIIGTGVFVLTGVAAARYAGPGLMLSFALAGLACAFAALVYAELAAMVPVSGSAYTYSYATMGEAVAWIVGWNLVLEYAVSAGAVAAGWSGYFTGILGQLGVVLPAAITNVPAEGGVMDVPATAIALLVTGLLVNGVRHGARVNAALVFVKLFAILLFLALAGPKVDADLWTPFAPFGWQGIATGAAIIFFAYIGFDAVATAAEETRDPQRNLPIGIIASLLICTAIYLTVAAVLTGVAPYTSLDVKEPVAFALRLIGYDFGAAVVAAGALAGITTVLLVLIFAQARIFFVMARDGLLPTFLSRINAAHGTPQIATLLTGIGVAGVAGFLPLGAIAELSNIGTLFAFVAVSLGVMILRRARPDIVRPFRTPVLWFVGPAAVASCGYLMISLPATTWVRFGIWSVIGAIVYAAYGYRRSPLRRDLAAPTPESAAGSPSA